MNPRPACTARVSLATRRLFCCRLAVASLIASLRARRRGCALSVRGRAAGAARGARAVEGGRTTWGEWWGAGSPSAALAHTKAPPGSRCSWLASGGCKPQQTRPWLGLVDLSRIPSGGKSILARKWLIKMAQTRQNENENFQTMTNRGDSKLLVIGAVRCAVVAKRQT